MPIKLQPKGIGRRDYTKDIYIQPIPVLRGPIKSYVEYKYWETVNPGETVVYEVKYNLSNYVTNITVTADACVLIELMIYESNQATMTIAGWGKIELVIPSTLPLQNVRIEITNHGDVPVSISYSHMAYLGVENLVPINYANQA